MLHSIGAGAGRGVGTHTAKRMTGREEFVTTHGRALLPHLRCLAIVVVGAGGG
jgi:hypothetical protein